MGAWSRRMRHRARAAAFAFYSSDSPSRENFAGRFPELELDLCGVPPHVVIAGAYLARFLGAGVRLRPALVGRKSLPGRFQ